MPVSYTHLDVYKRQDVQELDDYLTACALSLSDTDTYELLSAEENEEYSKNLSYPVYIVTYTSTNSRSISFLSISR